MWQERAEHRGVVDRQRERPDTRDIRLTPLPEGDGDEELKAKPGVHMTRAA